MAFNSNFESVRIVDGKIEVAGSSSEPEGMELLFRAVSIQQGEVVASGRINGNLKWVDSIELVEGLTQGATVVALGTETYRVRSEDLGQPAFATFTWAEAVTLG